MQNDEQAPLMDLATPDPAEAKRTELLTLFPETHTEGGKIDFEQLRRALGEMIDAGKERYGMNWPGKADCFKTIQAPSMGTLLPMRDGSVNFDETQNIIIEGDNLEVLKLLQKAYLGKVKMIYIDPPYNTGKDFIYPDNYAENLHTYLEYTGQVDAEGKRFGTNTEVEGRFHSNWLRMMYPRLYLAKNLMRDDGLIFITVDDTEQPNLRIIMNEIFGEENFVACIAWEKRYTRSNNAKRFYSLKDWVVVYRKSDVLDVIREPRTEKADLNYTNPDDDPRGAWMTSSYVNPAVKAERPTLVYPIQNPTTGEQVEHETHAWKYSKQEHDRHVAEERLWWGQEGEAKYPRLKLYLSEASDGMVPIDIWKYQDAGTTDDGGTQVKELFDGEAVFDNPKPTALVRKMIGLATRPNEGDIILDFFGGSGSTAHAVFEANSVDGGNRRAILVQLPEPTGRADMPTIAALCRERVRRAGSSLNDPMQTRLPGKDIPDLGFRAYALSSSCFSRWDGNVDGDARILQLRLEGHVSHVAKGRRDQDILVEVLLKSGFELGTPVEERMFGKAKVYDVGSGGLFVCLERNLDIETIRVIAAERPIRAIFLDEAFAGDDQLKVNAIQTFRAAGTNDDKSDLSEFMTV